jgi:hypothetical protein
MHTLPVEDDPDADDGRTIGPARLGAPTRRGLGCTIAK